MQGIARLFVVCTVALPLLGAAVASAAPLAPQTPVARVGGVTIDLATVDRWREFSFGGAIGDVELLPRCLDSERAGPRCARLRLSARDQALEMLANMHHALAQARRTGIRVPRRPSLPRMYDSLDTVPAFDRSDRVLARRGIAAHFALERHAVEAQPPVTDADLVSAWRTQTGLAWFTMRQVRAEVLQLRSRVDADAALAAVRAGEPFTEVGPRLAPPGPGVFRGDTLLFAEQTPDEVDQRVAPVTAAVLSARPDVLVGPLPIDGAFYVLRVVQVVSEAERIALPLVRDRVRKAAESARAERAATRLWRRLKPAWRARTTCARRFAVRSVCGRVVARL